MATSLLSKARTAVLGKMHSLLDEVANTPDAYKQRIRDLEAAMADLLAAHDEAVGHSTGFTRQIDQAGAKTRTMQADIDLLLGDDDPTNDDAALQMQLELDKIATQVGELTALQQDAQSNAQQLDTAYQQLKAKHDEMVTQLSHLTLTSASTSAKNKAVSAIEAATGAIGDAGSVDDLRAHIDSANDAANARFARVVGDMSASTNPAQAAALARAKAALEQRRAQIAAHAVDSASAPSTTA